jgi:hypothetical protein
METTAMLRLALIAAFALAACQTDAAPRTSRGRPPGAPERQLAQITAVEVRKQSPQSVSVTVKAMAPTPGYTNLSLRPVTYIQRPPDGIYDLTAVGTPPSGIVAQVLTPVEFRYVWQTYPGEMKGVRVHATGGAMVAMLPGGR